MRSGISFFDWTTFKKTVFRFWPLWGVYLVGWLFALPLNGLTMLRLDANAMPGINYGYLENFTLYTIPRSVTGDSLIIFVVFGVLAAMAVFSHLYNPRSANLFGSLPIRREGLFLTHYLAGLSFLIVPNVVIFLLTLLVEAAGGEVVWTGLLFWLAVACGEGFFFYTLAVFCAMFTGHLLALPAFYGIINGLIIGITGLVTVVLQSFYYGFAGVPDSVYETVLWFTPVGKLYQAVRYERYALPVDTLSSTIQWELGMEGLGTVGIYAVVTVALAAAAFFLYRARRLESAGDVVAVKAMRPVFRYGVALCAGLALGLGTMVILYGGEIMLMVAIVVWGIIGYFAAEMLLQKSFKVFKKWKGALAVTAVFLALFCVVGFDLTGFETRVPDAWNVTSVEVSGLNGGYSLGDSGDYQDMEFTDPERIRDVIILHQAAVDQQGAETLHGSEVTYLSITYHLKGGGTMSRRYNLHFNPGLVDREGSAAWAIQQIYEDRELYWQLYGFDRLESYLAAGGRLNQAAYEKYGKYDGIGEEIIFYGGDAEVLLAAVKEDFFAGRIGARRVTLNTSGNKAADEFISFNAYRQDGNGYDSHYITIAMSDTASSTLAVLEEMADRAAVAAGPEYSDGVIVEPTTVFG